MSYVLCLMSYVKLGLWTARFIDLLEASCLKRAYEVRALCIPDWKPQICFHKKMIVSFCLDFTDGKTLLLIFSPHII